MSSCGIFCHPADDADKVSNYYNVEAPDVGMGKKRSKDRDKIRNNHPDCWNLYLEQGG